MKYYLFPNKETQRLEIIVTNHKGNEETRIHGDDTLFFTNGKGIVPAQQVYDFLSAVELPTNEDTIDYETGSRNDTDNSA